MSSRQRTEVFAGTRKKTSGGLTKADLTKNKRGKIVSKKKSVQAANQNNLGSLLHDKGDWDGAEKLYRCALENHASPNDPVDFARSQVVPILHEISLSQKAEKVRKAFEVSMLAEIKDGHRLEHVHQWGQKAVGMALRIAAVLELFQRASEGVEGAQIFKKKISEQSMKAAVQIVDVLSYHFVYTMEDKSSINLQTYVLDKLGDLGGEATRRDLRRKCQAFKNDAELEPYLDLLEKSERITREEKKNRNQVVSEIIKSNVNTD